MTTDKAAQALRAELTLEALEIRRLTIQTADGLFTYHAATGAVIENISKSGMYCDVPWYRVSTEDGIIKAEFPAHNVIGVYFNE